MADEVFTVSHRLVSQTDIISHTMVSTSCCVPMLCVLPAASSPLQQSCPSGVGCVLPSSVCDGKDDCLDGSDETSDVCNADFNCTASYRVSCHVLLVAQWLPLHGISFTLTVRMSLSFLFCHQVLGIESHA